MLRVQGQVVTAKTRLSKGRDPCKTIGWSEDWGSLITTSQRVFNFGTYLPTHWNRRLQTKVCFNVPSHHYWRSLGRPPAVAMTHENDRHAEPLIPTFHYQQHWTHP